MYCNVGGAVIALSRVAESTSCVGQVHIVGVWCVKPGVEPPVVLLCCVRLGCPHSCCAVAAECFPLTPCISFVFEPTSHPGMCHGAFHPISCSTIMLLGLTKVEEAYTLPVKGLQLLRFLD